MYIRDHQYILGNWLKPIQTGRVTSNLTATNSPASKAHSHWARRLAFIVDIRNMTTTSNRGSDSEEEFWLAHFLISVLATRQLSNEFQHMQLSLPLGSIQTRRANVKSTASLLCKNYNPARPVWMLRLINVFQNQRVVFYAHFV